MIRVSAGKVRKAHHRVTVGRIDHPRVERRSVEHAVRHTHPERCIRGKKTDEISNWCINCVLVRVMDAVKETIADVSSISPSSERIDEISPSSL